ncbi:hypothetical protein KUTeg_024512 [Tegillarca granosa]|uniref:Uncharacterized protein n=1 Tax=Tegillarca granosa TaxID=220873 RepID=A0ABQ9DXJ5_TEGGR|nr:hypothetical protein KUTeg_024512 [Tegillarca granosa]
MEDSNTIISYLLNVVLFEGDELYRTRIAELESENKLLSNFTHEACNGLSDGILTDKDLIKGIYKVANLYYNYTGYTKCLDVEMVMPMCSNGKTDMFQPSPWNFEEYSKACYQRWKVYPRKNWIRQQYLGKNLKSTSNIIFSNGYLDPWSSGGVLDSQSASLISIFISSGAHHLDLRSSNIGDPPDVRSARQQEKNIIIKWLGMDRF